MKPNRARIVRAVLAAAVAAVVVAIAEAAVAVVDTVEAAVAVAAVTAGAVAIAAAAENAAVTSRQIQEQFREARHGSIVPRFRFPLRRTPVCLCLSPGAAA